MRFAHTQSLSQFQKFIESVYGIPDSRIFSLSDLLMNQQRFTMRALKGIRKEDHEKLTYNSLLAFSWIMAVCNRLHIDIETATWNRFPYLCSYCGSCPCECKVIKPAKRMKLKPVASKKPKSLKAMQEMFGKIYPASKRSLADAGVHLAEEMGEVSEAVHVFLGEHKDEQFLDIREELADYVGCIMGVANSANIDFASGLAKMYGKDCHVCHEAPCVCKFSYVAAFKS